jgi:hypothetical protein
MKNAIQDRLHEDIANGNYWTNNLVFKKKDIIEFSDEGIDRLVRKCLQKIVPNDIVTRIDYEFFDDSSSREFSYGYDLIGTISADKVRFGQIRIIPESDVENLEVRRFIPNHIKFYFWDDIFKKIVDGRIKIIELQTDFGNSDGG